MSALAICVIVFLFIREMTKGKSKKRRKRTAPVPNENGTAENGEKARDANDDDLGFAIPHIEGAPPAGGMPESTAIEEIDGHCGHDEEQEYEKTQLLPVASPPLKSRPAIPLAKLRDAVIYAEILGKPKALKNRER